MGIKPIYNVRNINNLKDMIEQSAQLFGDKNAFLLKSPDGDYHGITYSRFKQDMDAVGTAMVNLGLKDKFIAVIGENRYEWCVTYLATVNGVGVIVPLDKELSRGEIENLLRRSGASAVIFSGKYNRMMRELAGSLPELKYLIDMDSQQDSLDFMSFAEMVERGRKLHDKGDRAFLDAPVNNEKMSMLLFTSGTTGDAKGVMLSHKNICSNIMSTCSMVYIDSNDSSVSILPIHHTYECTLGFLTLMYSGGTMSFSEGLKHIARNLKEFEPTLLISVPLMIEGMYKKIWEQAGKKRGMKTKLKTALLVSGFLFKYLKIDIRKKLFKPIHENLGGKIRLIISGAAALSPKVCEGLTRMGFTVYEGYGLTECSPLVLANADKFYKCGSTGVPIPGVDVRIDNPNEKGVGEIQVRGDNVMLGYFKNREDTEKTFKNGWLRTGDLAYMDAAGILYITGRSKNVIVTKNGKNIYPEEVESYLNMSPYVQESLVWGRLDEASGETVVNAQIFPDIERIKEKLKVAQISKEDILKTLNEVVKGVNGNMPLYKRVREFRVRETEFIKTTTRKIKRYIEKTN